jgi:hypothetical protein
MNVRTCANPQSSEIQQDGWRNVDDDGDNENAAV